MSAIYNFKWEQNFEKFFEPKIIDELNQLKEDPLFRHTALDIYNACVLLSKESSIAGRLIHDMRAAWKKKMAALDASKEANVKIAERLLEKIDEVYAKVNKPS